VLAQAAQGNAQAQLALDVLAHETRHWIGSFLAQLNGADALVFTAGIGENQAGFRQAVCANLDQLGLELEPARNLAAKGCEAVISTPRSPVKIMVIPTNEELVVAREVRRFLASAAKASPNAAPASRALQPAASSANAAPT